MMIVIIMTVVRVVEGQHKGEREKSWANDGREGASGTRDAEDDDDTRSYANDEGRVHGKRKRKEFV